MNVLDYKHRNYVPHSATDYLLARVDADFESITTRTENGEGKTKPTGNHANGMDAPWASRKRVVDGFAEEPAVFLLIVGETNLKTPLYMQLSILLATFKSTDTSDFHDDICKPVEQPGLEQRHGDVLATLRDLDFEYTRGPSTGRKR